MGSLTRGLYQVTALRRQDSSSSAVLVLLLLLLLLLAVPLLPLVEGAHDRAHQVLQPRPRPLGEVVVRLPVRCTVCAGGGCLVKLQQVDAEKRQYECSQD